MAAHHESKGKAAPRACGSIELSLDGLEQKWHEKGNSRQAHEVIY
jgi:hypothetical protein